MGSLSLVPGAGYVWDLPLYGWRWYVLYIEHLEQQARDQEQKLRNG